MSAGLLSPVHLALLAAILLLLFGGRRLPALGRAAGMALRRLGRPDGRTELPGPEDTAAAERLAGARRGPSATAVGVALVRQPWALRALVRVLPPPLRVLARLLMR
jgi:hypothetical protein